MRAILCLTCATALAWAPAAVAQVSAGAKATAEALFDDAIALMKAGSLAPACTKLETSQRIDPAVGTLLYLAECYEKTGRTASAWVTFREAAGLARSLSQTQRANLAQARADQLQADLARLTIDVSSEARAVPGLRVRYGPLFLEPELYGVAVPVDPGQTSVEASAPGYAAFSRPLSIEVRGRSVVTIPALVPLAPGSAPAALEPKPAPAVPVAAEPPPAPVSATASADERALPVLPLVLGGVGIVGLGVGSYFGLKAISNASDANDLCPEGVCRESRGTTVMDDARSAARVSNVAVGVGLVALSSGLILYFLQPDGSKGSQVGLVPSIGHDWAGLDLKGRL